MPRSTWPRPLADLDVFAGCSTSELERVAGLMTMLNLDEGTVLIAEGGIGLEFIVIVEGTASVWIGRGDAAERVATLGRGEFVGEMSLLTRGRRTATVKAEGPLTVLVASAGEFAGLLEVSPLVARRIAEAAAARADANRAA